MSAPRRGKYCPRCRTMTFLDRAVCETCGHGFRTGLDAAVADMAPTPAPDALHRTMQFTLPPVASRPGLPPEPPTAAPEPLRRASLRDFRRSKRLLGLSLTLAALLGPAVLIGLTALVGPRPQAAPVVPTPMGAWESALAGRAASRARLQFVFWPGGGGMFSWREAGAGLSLAPRSGRSALRWHLDPAGRLALTIQRPPAGDPVAGTLTDIFNSHPWAWRLSQGQLLLGNLTFQRR